MSVSISQPASPAVPPGLKMTSERPNMFLQSQAYSLVLPTEATVLSWPWLSERKYLGLTQTMAGPGHGLWTAYPIQNPRFSLEQCLLKPNAESCGLRPAVLRDAAYMCAVPAHIPTSHPELSHPRGKMVVHGKSKRPSLQGLSLHGWPSGDFG